MKRLVLIALSALAVLAAGCTWPDWVQRLGNVPNHCTVVNVDGENWLELRGVCSFGNPFEALN